MHFYLFILNAISRAMNRDLIHQYIWFIFSEQKDINLFIYLFYFLERNSYFYSARTHKMIKC